MRSTIGGVSTGAARLVCANVSRAAKDSNRYKRDKHAAGRHTRIIVRTGDGRWHNCLPAAMAIVKAAPPKPILFAPLPAHLSGTAVGVGFFSGIPGLLQR